MEEHPTSLSAACLQSLGRPQPLERLYREGPDNPFSPLTKQTLKGFRKDGRLQTEH